MPNESLINRDETIKGIKKRIDNTDSAYELSMLIIEAALLDDKKMYSHAKIKFLNSLLGHEIDESKWLESLDKLLSDKDDERAFNLWLLGRLLIAEEMAIQRSDFANMLMTKIQTYLNEYKINLDGKDTPFIIWAREYIASYYAMISNDDAYSVIINKIKSDIEIFAKKQVFPDEKQSYRNDLMWCYVMLIHAVGLKKDTLNFNEAKKNVSQKDESLLTSLKNISADSNGYRAWAMAIVIHAAAKMGDFKTYDAIVNIISDILSCRTETEDGKVLARLFFERAMSEREGAEHAAESCDDAEAAAAVLTPLSYP